MSIFDALNNGATNPGIMALLGMAQGFGQAAMPQPYKGGTPFGAALGMAAGGFGQGVQNAYKTQLEQAQAQAQQMQNKIAASNLPLILSSNDAVAQAMKNPAFIAKMMGTNAAASPSGPAQPNGPVIPITASQAFPKASAASSSTQSSPKSSGQMLPVTGIAAPQTVAVKSPGGAVAQVSADAAPRFQGLFNDLEAAGYKLNPSTTGGFNDRFIAGTTIPSQHAYGRAVDVNWDKNPNGTSGPADIPAPLANSLAQKWGLAWGGNWSGKDRDPMHFEVAGNAPPVPGDTGQAPAVEPKSSGAPTGAQITPGNAWLLYKQYEAEANDLETQQNFAKQMQQRGIMFPMPSGDPAMKRATAQKLLALSIAGPQAGAEAQAKAGVELQTAGPIAGAQARAKSDNEITQDRYGNRYRGPDYLGRGPEVKEGYDNSGNYVFKDVGALGPDRKPLDTGADNLVAKLGPSEQERQQEVQKVQSDQLKKDGAVIDESLAHVIDNVTPAKQQLFQLRQLAENPDTATGAAGQLRSQFKNWVQTFAPDFVKDLTGDASPSQEFNKIALMGAGKQERGDLGARGGFRAMELYLNANPNLDMQPQANHDMANALLISHQFHADYAQGATDYYQKNYDKYVDPKNREPYQRLSKYDQAFNATMKPELYAAAISAINGKPSDEWAKGLSQDQVKIVGGILQRTDPSAAIDMHGQMVPVSKFTAVIGPSDIGPGAPSGR